MPDACTFRNVIKAIDTQQLHTAFVEWMQSIAENVTGVAAIDGKQARRTKDARKSPLHVVSAFSAECGLVLRQLACEEKSNEITAIPKLLEMLEINGCIITIDAMGTQTEIAKKITEKGADYILALKENQKTFYEDVRLFFEEYRTNPAELDPVCCAVSHSQGHGRYESRARADNSAENFNVLRHWAYNLLKSETSVRGSFSDKQFKCLLDEAFLDKILCSASCS